MESASRIHLDLPTHYRICAIVRRNQTRNVPHTEHTTKSTAKNSAKMETLDKLVVGDHGLSCFIFDLNPFGCQRGKPGSCAAYPLQLSARAVQQCLPRQTPGKQPLWRANV